MGEGDVYSLHNKSKHLVMQTILQAIASVCPPEFMRVRKEKSGRALEVDCIAQYGINCSRLL